jgi:hypothetical protein
LWEWLPSPRRRRPTSPAGNSGAEKPEERFGEMVRITAGSVCPAGYHQARGTSVTIDKKPLQPR